MERSYEELLFFLTRSTRNDCSSLSPFHSFIRPCTASPAVERHKAAWCAPHQRHRARAADLHAVGHSYIRQVRASRGTYQSNLLPRRHDACGAMHTCCTNSVGMQCSWAEQFDLDFLIPVNLAMVHLILWALLQNTVPFFQS